MLLNCAKCTNSNSLPTKNPSNPIPTRTFWKNSNFQKITQGRNKFGHNFFNIWIAYHSGSWKSWRTLKNENTPGKFMNFVNLIKILGKWHETWGKFLEGKKWLVTDYNQFDFVNIPVLFIWQYVSSVQITYTHSICQYLYYLYEKLFLVRLLIILVLWRSSQVGSKLKLIVQKIVSREQSIKVELYIFWN